MNLYEIQKIFLLRESADMTNEQKTNAKRLLGEIQRDDILYDKMLPSLYTAALRSIAEVIADAAEHKKLPLFLDKEDAEKEFGVECLAPFIDKEFALKNAIDERFAQVRHLANELKDHETDCAHLENGIELLRDTLCELSELVHYCNWARLYSLSLDKLKLIIRSSEADRAADDRWSEIDNALFCKCGEVVGSDRILSLLKLLEPVLSVDALPDNVNKLRESFLNAPERYTVDWHKFDNELIRRLHAHLHLSMLQYIGTYDESMLYFYKNVADMYTDIMYKPIRTAIERVHATVPEVKNTILCVLNGNEFAPAAKGTVLPDSGLATLTLASIVAALKAQRDRYQRPIISIDSLKRLRLISEDTRYVFITDSGYDLHKEFAELFGRSAYTDIFAREGFYFSFNATEKIIKYLKK